MTTVDCKSNTPTILCQLIVLVHHDYFILFKKRAKLKNLKKLFIGNLPASTSETDLQNLFAQFGTVRSLKLVTDIFTGQCKGFAFIGMEGHEARAAIAGLNGKDFNGNSLRVGYEAAKPKYRK